MAKKKNTVNEADINTVIKKEKKKMMMIFGVIIAIAVGVGGFFVYKMNSEAKAKEALLQKELDAVALKDYPVEETEKLKIYSRDITKQTYILKDGAILFEGTIVFYNKLCANLYNGITDRDEELSTEPDMTQDSVFGDKLTKDALNRLFQSTDKKTLSSTDKVAELVKEAINKQFKDTFGSDIVKQVLVTNHIVQ